MDAVIVENVHKTFRNGAKALEGVSLTIAQGEVFGVLGPNGAGKTSHVFFGLLSLFLRAIRSPHPSPAPWIRNFCDRFNRCIWLASPRARPRPSDRDLAPLVRVRDPHLFTKRE